MGLPGRIESAIAPLGEINVRGMYCGHGLYRGETIFGILSRGKLFKVDERTKNDFLARRMGPFRQKERQTPKPYFEMPPEVLGDPESLLSWARQRNLRLAHDRFDCVPETGVIGPKGVLCTLRRRLFN